MWKIIRELPIADYHSDADNSRFIPRYGDENCYTSVRYDDIASTLLSFKDINKAFEEDFDL